MKLKTWTAGIAALVLSAAPVFAVEGTAQWTDSLVTPASCDDNCCDPGCCDPVECGDACDCGSGVGGGGILSGIGNGCVENFTLAGLLGLGDDAWLEVGGWTQMGYHDELTGLSVTRGDVLDFNDIPDEILVQQQWFYAGHTADGSEGLDVGGRVDVIYGTDAQKTQSFGNPGAEFDNGWDHGVYGWAMPQLYGEVAINDLSIKVGHFYTAMGYEVVPATGNFFYSHALTMFNSEPFTHTGALATYTGFEGLTLYSGWVAGWDTGFTNSNAGSAILSGFSASVSDDVTFTYLNCYGNYGLRSAGFDPTAPNSDDDYSHSIVLNMALTEKLTCVLQTDYLRIDNEDAGVFEDDLSLVNYLIYQWRDNIGLGNRIEWWKNEGVSRYEWTNGVNVKLLSNLIVRPEYRIDWEPATDDDEEIAAVDMILTY